MVVEGKDNLELFLQAISVWLRESPWYSKKQEASYLTDNANLDVTVAKMLLKPIIIYVSNKSLVTNNSYMDLNYISNDIIAIEDIFSLLFLNNLPTIKKRDIEVKWILCGAHANIKQSIIFSQLSFIDHYLVKNTGSTVGLLDYIEMERTAKLIWGETLTKKVFKHKSCRSIISCILRIFPSAKKNPYATEAAEKLFLPKYKPTKKDYDSIYIFNCPCCNESCSIILHNNSRKDKKNYKKSEFVVRYFSQNNIIYGEMICKMCREKNMQGFIRQVDNIPKTVDEKDLQFMRLYFTYKKEYENSADLISFCINSIMSNKKSLKDGK